MTTLDRHNYVDINDDRWWTPGDWLFAPTPGEYQKIPFHIGGGHDYI